MCIKNLNGGGSGVVANNLCFKIKLSGFRQEIWVDASRDPSTLGILAEVIFHLSTMHHSHLRLLSRPPACLMDKPLY